MHRIVQDVQQLRNLISQQAQIEHQCITLCNRIEQAAIQVSQQASFVSQGVPLTQGTMAMGGNVGSIPSYNPSVLNQVLATEQQFRSPQPQTYGSQWQ